MLANNQRTKPHRVDKLCNEAYEHQLTTQHVQAQN